MMLKIIAIQVLMFFQQTPVSFTGIEYINRTDTIKVSVRIDRELFLRDYQQTIFDDLDLNLLRSFKPFPEDLANNYLNLKINICVNNKQKIGKLFSIQEDNTDFVFTLLYRTDTKPKSVTVRNSILTGLSSRIQNFIIISSSNFESTAILTPEQPEVIFFLKK